MHALTRHLPRLRWQLTQWQQRLGFWGLLAVVAMMAALVIQRTARRWAQSLRAQDPVT